METAIRNELCFQELRNFNDRGEFLGRHPLVKDGDELSELREKLLKDPEGFLQESKNADLNITRYTSYIGSDKYTDEQKTRFREMLDVHRHRKELIENVLKETIYARKGE